MRKNEEGKLVDENGLTEEEFLSRYQPRDYERPSVTVDMLIFAVDKSGENKRLLLIKRKNHPYLGCWALPGGFVEMKESLQDAAARELEEETGVKGMRLEQLYTFGEVERDPRTRIISVAYMAVVDDEELPVQAGDDAAEAVWFRVGREEGKNGEFIFLESAEAGVRFVYAVEKEAQPGGERRCRPMFDIQEERGLAFDHIEAVRMGMERL
ncbi:NUDIX domain-containing protein [Eisenbergiella sp.]